MAEEDHEALFSSYPSAAYYVQSPSTISHVNSTDCRHNNNESALVSPFQSGALILNPINKNSDVSRFTLSRYSSSRGSNNSFLQEKKITENGETHLIGCNDEVRDDDEIYYDDEKRRNGFWKYFSFRTSSSCVWISLQISWRILVSLGAALFVFFLATKPPPPEMTIKMEGIQQFGLGEGVDGSGVTTKILTFNCSIKLEIDNKSKIFGLHIQPPIMDLSFQRFFFATSQGPELYAESSSKTSFQLYVGTKNKAMYGAGRSMEEMLKSGKGLPLLVRIRVRSSFHVVWNLIRPKFHHHGDCFLVLHSAYDRLHHTQAYKSSCRLQSKA